MTLQEFFDIISQNPEIILFYFFALALSAFLSGALSRGKANESPWNYLASILMYMAAIPGIFAITLNIYLFLFEKQSILDANIYTQFLPIISMAVVFLIISRKADIRSLPGFDRLSGLILMITAVILIMWILDRTHIVLFSYLPFQYVIMIMIGIFILLRLAWSRLISTR